MLQNPPGNNTGSSENMEILHQLREMGQRSETMASNMQAVDARLDNLDDRTTVFGGRVNGLLASRSPPLSNHSRGSQASSTHSSSMQVSQTAVKFERGFPGSPPGRVNPNVPESGSRRQADRSPIQYRRSTGLGHRLGEVSERSQDIHTVPQFVHDNHYIEDDYIPASIPDRNLELSRGARNAMYDVGAVRQHTQPPQGPN